MKKSTRKTLWKIVAVLCCAAILAGCGAPASSSAPSSSSASQSSSAGSAADSKTDTAPVHITHYYNYDWADDNFPNTPIGQEVQRLTNIELEFMKSPTADNQKLNMMMTSNQLPDLVTLDRNDPTVAKLIESGQVYALSDLIDEYAPEIWENSDPEYFKYYNWSDGKQYYFPSFLVTNSLIQNTDCDPVSFMFSAMRSDVYEALGSPKLSTPDSLYNVLVEAKQKFPELEGWYFGPYSETDNLFKASEFIGYLFPATQFGCKIYEKNEDGTLVSGVRSEKFQNFIKFMNKCYVNGLLDPSSFADSSDVSNAKIAEGNYILMSGSHLDFREDSPILSKPDAHWVPMDYLDEGEYFKDGSGWTATFVTKNCKNLEAVMRYVSFCASEEGRRLISTGIEGVHYEWKEIDGKRVPRFLPEWQELCDKSWDEFTRTGGFTNLFAFQDEYIHNQARSLTEGEKSEYNKKIAAICRPHALGDIAIGLINPVGTSPEGIIQSKLCELATSYYPKMIMAASEEDAMNVYAEFIARAEEMGLADLEAAWTKNAANFKE